MEISSLDGHIIHCGQLYYGVVYNGLSALSLLEGNLLGTAERKTECALCIPTIILQISYSAASPIPVIILSSDQRKG